MGLFLIFYLRVRTFFWGLRKRGHGIRTGLHIVRFRPEFRVHVADGDADLAVRIVINLFIVFGSGRGVTRSRFRYGFVTALFGLRYGVEW